MTPHRDSHSRIILTLATLLATAALGACASTAENLADGGSLRAIVIAQTDDPFASTRHGTMTPQGTDPEVAASAVKSLRERGTGAVSRPGLFDILLGGMSGK